MAMPRRIRLWLDAQPRERRRLYGALLAIVLLTLPCYGTGLGLLALAGPTPEAGSPTPQTDRGEATAWSPPTSAPAPGTAVIRESPPPTESPRPSSTPTASLPTETVAPLGSPEFVVITMPPLFPTSTEAPSAPPTEPPPPPTDEPIPTQAPVETPPPQPTDEPPPEPTQEPPTAGPDGEAVALSS